MRMPSEKDKQEIRLKLIAVAESYKFNKDDVIEESEELKLVSQPDETPENIEPVSETMEEARSNMRNFFDYVNKGDRSGYVEPEVVHEKLKPDSQEFKKAMSKPKTKKKTDWAERGISVTPGVVTVDGAELAYKLARKPVNWGRDLSESVDDLSANLDLIRSRISKDIFNHFGGWSRIHEIVVSGGQLIINKVMYVPLIEKEYISRLPLDVADYFSGGCIAPLFNWVYLKKMTSLSSFVCDDPQFYVMNIGDDLGLGRRIGVSSLFNICPELMVFSLGGEVVSRDNLNAPESKGIKESVVRQKKFLNIMDGYKFDIYAGTNGLQDYTFTNLKNYATNRGSKGIVRFCGGVLTRTALAASAGTLNLSMHLLGGVKNAVTQVFKDAMTPVDDGDL